MQQLLRRQPDDPARGLARAASLVLLLVFAGWLAWFGVAAPWDLGTKVDAGEFLGRFAGILLLLALIFSPLLIAFSLDRRERP